LSVLLSSFVYADTKGDIDGDDKVGLAEAVNALQVASGLADQVRSRWCDQGDGTVKDRATGLVWLQKADWGGTMTYDEARNQAGMLCEGSEGANLSDGSAEGDWRMPTGPELYSLANGIDAFYCAHYWVVSELWQVAGESCKLYWSSSTVLDEAGCQWGMYLQPDLMFSLDRSSSYWLLPVRSDN
ncbi:MAG: DUF1566 domain-containing protein, partial [Desulfobacteraceae bacterium]|jgi:hypothetical protein|nr:DUF1566 domain-containing protein [Desulfobacteraceae bacterium]